VKRVVVTGIGSVSPVGLSWPEAWQNLIEGKSGVGLVSLFDASSYPVQVAGEVRNFPFERFSPKLRRVCDRATLFALAAAHEAAQSAGINVPVYEPASVGVIFGSAVGGIGVLLDSAAIFFQEGGNYKKLSAHFLTQMLVDSPSGQLAIELGAKGLNMAPVSACATGSQAVGEAFEAVKNDVVRVAFAGGTEAPLVPLIYAGFCQMRALASPKPDPQSACCPFDARRDGFVISEGATCLVLEQLDHALARGANIIAEIVGYGASNDAFHMATPDPEGEGMKLSMEKAICSAGISKSEIDYINAHGTGTELNDKLETKAIREVFGKHASDVMVSSTKSMTGHMMGTAGAFEAAVIAMVVKTGIIPPTINYLEPDPDCDLNYVPNKCVTANVLYALSNSFGLGGHNASLVMKRFEL
jgi:3-oxoacyl-[acyl-carrier-protein] synthase II